MSSKKNRAPQLNLNQIADQVLRDNLKALQDFGKSLLFQNFRFFEITIPEAVTHMRYPHNLGYLPKDVLQSSLIGAGSLTWNYDKFDQDNLDITTTGACVVRAFIGTHLQGSGA